MNEFCTAHGLMSRSSDQYKYILEKKASVLEALQRADDWDSDVENKASRERALSAPVPQQGAAVKVEASSQLPADVPLQHNKRVRELMGEQNKWLASIARSLKW